MPYVHRFRDRHGKVRYYYRRAGERKPLRGDPGSADFMSDYQAASSQFTTAAKPKDSPALSAAPDGSIAKLIVSYMGSIRYRKLKPSSQAVQRRIYTRFAETHGKSSVTGLTRLRIEKIIADMADTPGAATSLLKRLKSLMVFAVQTGWITVDPTYRMQGFTLGEIHTWTEEEIDAFEAHWPVGSKERLAYALHLYTGQRTSDVHRMTWADIRDGEVEVVQVKTGTKIGITIHDDLSPVLALADKATAAIIVTSHGLPFTVKGYSQWINAAIAAAKLPERCVAHGLRKAAARRLAEAGCSANQIAAVTGHKTLAEVERYTKAANQRRMARDAMQAEKANRPGKPAKTDLANQPENAMITDTKKGDWRLRQDSNLRPAA